jgi:RecB family exonuclease
VKNWLESELIGALEGAKLLPEAPFVLELGPSLVRGSIDLLAERPDGTLLVIDYKTDRLGGTAPAQHMERYEVQRKLYAVAASLRAGGPVTTMYSFLERPGDPQTDDYGPVEIAALRVELEALVAELETGDFEVTATPHRATTARPGPGSAATTGMRGTAATRFRWWAERCLASASSATAP